MAVALNELSEVPKQIHFPSTSDSTVPLKKGPAVLGHAVTRKLLQTATILSSCLNTGSVFRGRQKGSEANVVTLRKRTDK